MDWDWYEAGGEGASDLNAGAGTQSMSGARLDERTIAYSCAMKSLRSMLSASPGAREGNRGKGKARGGAIIIKSKGKKGRMISALIGTSGGKTEKGQMTLA